MKSYELEFFAVFSFFLDWTASAMLLKGFQQYKRERREPPY